MIKGGYYMKILLVGNIGVGKTTIVKTLQKLLNYEYCSIDDCRRSHSDGTVAGEYLAHHNFMKACASKYDQILEFSGAGCHKYSIRRALEESKDQLITVFCLSDKEWCKQRLEGREWDIPTPWNFDINEHMEMVKRELTEDLRIGFWEDSSRNWYSIILKSPGERDVQEITRELLDQINKIRQKE